MFISCKNVRDFCGGGMSLGRLGPKVFPYTSQKLRLAWATFSGLAPWLSNAKMFKIIPLNKDKTV